MTDLSQLQPILMQFYCLDCNRVGKLSAYCEWCASNTVWPLQKWLDRVTDLRGKEAKCKS